MNRSIRLATSALTACAALLLTACGGSDDSKDIDKIAGADASGEKSASPSPSATADGIDRPAIKLPSDMKMLFENRETGDAVKDAILADNERTVSTVWQAMATGDAKHAGMAFYYTDQALTGVYKYATSNIDKNISWTGTLRYYDRQVTTFSKTSAAVTYCVDESRADLKNRKTGKRQGTKTTPNSYVYYNAGVKKNEDGVWQIWDISEDRGAQKCQP
ncbi:hypothetical protein ACFVYR_13950 [Streptomyces sp. NPDC058284]|uniref:hypothetical protein n=1 Tax=unclassified Streptomyces TaxID=2593676 RepID=UPI00365E1E28